MNGASHSTIPGRRHKMVKVDLSNPYIRNYVTRFCAEHQRQLDSLRDQVPHWVAVSRAREEAAARAEGRPPRPLAAVLDVDEIVLCNVHMNAFRAPAGAQGPDAIDFHAADHYAGPDGRPWPRDDLRLNPLLPGARDLIACFHKHGARVYLVTGRLESIRAETVENLVYVGLAAPGAPAGQWLPGAPLFNAADLETGLPGGLLVMCPDAEYPPPGYSVRPYKESRRRAIEATHRIVANIGDQASDLGLYGDMQVLVGHPLYWCP